MENYNSFSWDSWQTNSSKFDWTENITTTTTGGGGGGSTHQSNSGDPNFICLNLGKRHYFGDITSSSSTTSTSALSMSKKGKQCYGGGPPVSTAAAVVTCQVEGCSVGLVNAKEYYRRHKVCEMHSKALKVVVMGLERRFCQQCSRFHEIGEFDESKRSCRRRLAGHNERRRKSLSQGCARSLLSSKSDTRLSPTDLSSRSSAALRDLIAENRAAILANQVIRDSEWYLHHNAAENQMLQSESHCWDRFRETGTHLTLDLMQGQGSGYGFEPAIGKTKEEDCNELWNSLQGAHLV